MSNLRTQIPLQLRTLLGFTISIFQFLELICECAAILIFFYHPHWYFLHLHLFIENHFLFGIPGKFSFYLFHHCFLLIKFISNLHFILFFLLLFLTCKNNFRLILCRLYIYEKDLYLLSCNCISSKSDAYTTVIFFKVSERCFRLKHLEIS